MTKTQLTQDDLDFMSFAMQTTPTSSTVPSAEGIDISEEELQFTQQAQQRPRPPKEVGRGRSLIDAPLKGFFNIAGRALGAMPTGEKTYAEVINEIFPTQDRFIEGALQRGVELGASGGATGLAGAARSVLGGVLGEGVSKAPFIPDWLKPYAEAAAEIGSLATPKLGKKILPSPKQSELVKEARRLGLTEKQIAPLIQGEKKLETLGKISGKRFRTQKALKGSREGLEKVFESLETHPKAKTVLAPAQSDTALSKIQNKMMKNMNDAERNLIRADFAHLSASPRAAEDFTKFFRDVNKSISKNPEARKALNAVKGDVIDAVKQISPELGRNFEITNKLYSNYSKMFSKLRPNFQKDLLGAGRHIMMGTVFGHYPALIEILGTEGAKNLSREMLINPRFQNLSRQIVASLNSGKMAVAKRLYDNLTTLVGKTNKKAAVEMSKQDIEDLIKPSMDEMS